MSVVNVDKNTIETEISKEVSTTVLFVNEAKSSSQKMLVEFKKAAEATGDKVVFLKKNFEEGGAIEEQYGIQSAPTTLFLGLGRKLGDLVGYSLYLEPNGTDGVFKRKIKELFDV